jgi:DNA recombination protein RmuC
METLTLILLVVVAILLVTLLLRMPTAGRDDGGSASMLMQQQIEALRAEVDRSLKNTADSLSSALNHTQQTLFMAVNDLRENVSQQLQNNTGQMGNRLDNAARVIQDVQNKLGELGKATQEIKELGQSVSKLEEMLRAPKLRGGLGELLLEDVLKQVLPPTSYSIQYRFKRGQTVDAMIHTAGGNIPIDSKFPLENFEKMIRATGEQEKRAAAGAFRKDVRKHIDSIAEKYILPDEGTFDFALMYIPAENIYYETIIKDESYGEENSLYSYAVQKHVVPVSPNSFYAYLRVIALGFKGLQIEKQAKEILKSLSRLDSELQKFQEIFATLGTQLRNALNNYDKADRQLSTFADRLKAIEDRTPQQSNDAPAALPNQLNVFGG